MVATRIYFYLATTTGNPFYGKGNARAWSLVAGFKPEDEPPVLFSRWNYKGEKEKVKKSEFNELPMLEDIYAELNKHFPIHPTFHMPDKQNLLVGYGLHTHDLPILLAKISMFKMRTPVERFKSIYQCRSYDIQQSLSFMGANWLEEFSAACAKRNIPLPAEMAESQLGDTFAKHEYEKIDAYVLGRLMAMEALDKQMRRR